MVPVFPIEDNKFGETCAIYISPFPVPLMTPQKIYYF